MPLAGDSAWPFTSDGGELGAGYRDGGDAASDPQDVLDVHEETDVDALRIAVAGIEIDFHFDLDVLLIAVQPPGAELLHDLNAVEPKRLSLREAGGDSPTRSCFRTARTRASPTDRRSGPRWAAPARSEFPD